MRWFFGLIGVTCVALVIYLGSALSSLTGLVAAARAGDGAAILARTDVKSLTHTLTDQIVGAYLDRIGGKRRISPLERMVANTYGASVADAMVSKLLTAENLTGILRTGHFDGGGSIPSFGVPSLARLNTDNVTALLRRVSLVKPVQLAIRISDSAAPENLAAIDLHYEGLDWKLSGIHLPQNVVADLAATLPVK